MCDKATAVTTLCECPRRRESMWNASASSAGFSRMLSPETTIVSAASTRSPSTLMALDCASRSAYGMAFSPAIRTSGTRDGMTVQAMPSISSSCLRRGDADASTRGGIMRRCARG